MGVSIAARLFTPERGYERANRYSVPKDRFGMYDTSLILHEIANTHGFHGIYRIGV
ncbi:MAG: hypothetical protein RMJ00_06970 [Nitrososphaerota archaeon]|nr:hypothetical protein [Candidatus Bathyarchaeota archaeon]MDW8062423.1 hypothetical protein [Nitrososphaerota archaeon]